jgi:hypothetical protein
VGARQDAVLKLRGRVVLVVEGRCVPHGFATEGCVSKRMEVSEVCVVAA